jgi:chaperonin cofactor prefoldin
MNEELLQMKFKAQEKSIGEVKADVEEMKPRIANLEKSDAVTNVKLDNLCDKLDKQTKSIYALIGTLITALVGFFFYVVQQGIFH